MKRYIRSETDSDQELARNSNDLKILARLARDEDGEIRKRVAENPNTPADLLAQLANDENKFVRQRVAQNSNTPAKALAQLANDEERWVRIYVAHNPSTLVDVLLQLVNDEDEDVRGSVAGNPNTPVDILVQLADDLASYVRWNVAQNSNTSAEALAQLASDKDKEVRQAARENPNCLVKSNKSKKWPSADEWYNIDSNDEFSDMWDRYLAGPEDEVNKQLQIFPEPSTQGGMGGMFIFDESDGENESIYVDFQDWCDRELEMAAESKNANEYKQKYTDFVEGLISENWR